ncbi:MAG: GC-type dockerin domain-anchored protein [Phycisphaerales bacterium JB060]
MTRFAILAASLAMATASDAQPVFPDIIEASVQADARVEVHVPFDPLVDIQSDFDDELPFPDAEVDALAGGTFGEPRALTTIDNWARATGGTSIDMGVTLNFQLDRVSIGTRRREAAGSWSQRVVFELDRPANVHLSVQPQPFDEIEYTEHEPGKLTGPDGVIVSGPPEPGASGWIWILDLAPGRYTFESFAAFEVSTEEQAQLGDAARHGVSFSFRPPRCRPDLDGDGELTIFDFLMFQNLFDARDDRADYDRDDAFTIFDFLAFQNAFDAGCE